MNERKKPANSNRHSMCRRDHGFMSQTFPFAKTAGKTHKHNCGGIRLLRKIYRNSWLEDVTANWQLKKPRGGRLEPEMLSGTAIDVYYGKNAEMQPQGLSPMNVLQHAYATGSGTDSIGQDPMTRQVKPWKPIFSELLEIVKTSVTQRSKYSDQEKAVIVSKLDCCNAVSMKWYFTVPGQNTEKKCGWHTDMSLNSMTNEPITGNNSQVSDTPVAILTFGGKKRLFFGFGKNKRLIEPETTFYMEQCDSKIILLHWEDEKYRHEGALPLKKFLHCSGMHPDNKNGVVMTLMYRHVKDKVLVHQETHNFVNPPERGDQDEFDETRNTWMDDQGIVEAQVLLMSKVQKYYDDTNN